MQENVFGETSVGKTALGKNSYLNKESETNDRGLGDRGSIASLGRSLTI